MPTTLGDLTLISPARWEYSFRYIDYTGDLRSESFITDAQVTLANLEALKAAVAAQTNSELYAVEERKLFYTVPDSGNAVSAPKESVSQNLVFLAKNPLGDSRNLFVPAPVQANFITNTDEIDPTSGLIVATLAAWVNVLPAGYGVVSARFTGRREKNKAVKI